MKDLFHNALTDCDWRNYRLGHNEVEEDLPDPGAISYKQETEEREKNPEEETSVRGMDQTLQWDNLVHLDGSKKVKEKCNENGVGIGEVVEIYEYWTVLYPLTSNLLKDRRAVGSPSQWWRVPELKQK